MKKRILGLCALLMLSGIVLSYGQKCKYEIDKKDPFTGEITRGISVKINNGFYFGFNKIGNKYDITIVVTLQASENISRQGDSIMFKVVSETNLDESKLVLYSIKDVTPSIMAHAHGTAYTATARYYGQYRIIYSIMEEQLKLLNNASITFVRLNVANQSYEMEIEPKQIKQLKQAIHCILQ